MHLSIQSRLPYLLAASCVTALVLAIVPSIPFAQSSGDANSGSQSSEALPAGVAAMVNGRPIAIEVVDKLERQLRQNDATTSREEILNELIDLEVLTQRAETQQLASKPEVAASLELQYSQTMANAYLEALSEELVVTEEQVRAEYDKQIQLLNRPEYRASHILLESEDDAKNAIAGLDAGSDFAQLAQEVSTGPSASNGGDLGWFDDDTMMAEFTAAVTQLEIDEYTKTPVQTQFGWHIIQLNDKRSGAMPDFDPVKVGIRNLMVQNILTERIGLLREQSDIKTAQ